MARICLGPITRALVVENPDTSLDSFLAEDGVKVFRVTHGVDEDELISLLNEHRAQALFKRSRVEVTRRVIESCPDLLVVQLCCIGDDSVDKAACADHGVLVFNDPVSNGRSVVELVVGHLVALSRRLYETDVACRHGDWDKSNTERYEIQGKTLGILGLGNIGRQVGRVATSMGMKVRFYDTRDVAVEVGSEFGWEAASNLVDLFRGSDYLTVHLSADDITGHSNAGLLSYELLSQLGADMNEESPRIFLNLARGQLGSSEDLLAAVRARQIRRAAVDVYPDEPRGKEPWTNPYADEPRIAVTPHIGAATSEAQPRIARRVSQTFRAFSRTGLMRDCVFGPRVRLGLTDDGEEGRALLVVVHGTKRGTKRAIDDAIFQAGASNLASAHKDFEHLGVAYDIAALDRPLSEEALHALVENAGTVTGDARAIRSVRQIALR